MSIFDKENRIQSNWMKFEKVGDKIEGTLIAKRAIFNQLSGRDQIVYEIKKTNGEYWNIGGKPGIDAQMQKVRVGQIVGFEFIKERKPSRAGYHPLKIIQIYANPDIIDEEWLQQHEEEIVSKQSEQSRLADRDEDEDMTDEDEDEDRDGDETDRVVDSFIGGGDDADRFEGDDSEEHLVSGKVPKWKEKELLKSKSEDEDLETITRLALEKFGPIGSAEDTKTRIMEETNLAFIVPNFEKIIETLEEMPDKRQSRVSSSKIIRRKRA